jgi:hypothetical protein
MQLRFFPSVGFSFVILTLPSFAAAQEPSPTAPPSTAAVAAEAGQDGGAPSSGFTLEARLPQTIAPVGLGLAAGTILSSIVGGPPPATLGYRGDGFALTVGPSIGRIGIDTSGASSTSVWYYGGAVLGEVAVTRSANRRMEGYLLFGASLAVASTSTSSSTGSSSSNNDGVSGKPAFGVLGGFGLRYWCSSHLGVGVEAGESYLSLPVGSSSSQTLDANGSLTTSTANLRGSVLSTFGDVHVALTL